MNTDKAIVQDNERVNRGEFGITALEALSLVQLDEGGDQTAGEGDTSRLRLL